eukprot:TRINITY_DN77208_c0_g1_i1.p1 TRINITY_DN77208_c0_g1~~TRINITY_DN77208_c0_g1_i1.p1  ORF type:complete len:161 (+),score=27.30 TRINITY_DN77208_c0_g1_i1:169-651(+)
MDSGSRQEVLRQHVALAPAECYDAFLRDVWLGGGGLPGPPPRIVVPGDPASGQGCVRVVPGGIHEEILLAKPGVFIEYHVASGPFPVSYHRGRVEFNADGGSNGAPSATLVTWTVDYTPVVCTGPLLSLVIRWSLGTMLRNLAAKAGSSSASDGSTWQSS